MMTRAGAPGPQAVPIGEVATPVFARLPDPSQLFASRAARYRQLASGHGLEAYLLFLAAIADIQHAFQDGLVESELPDEDVLQMEPRGNARELSCRSPRASGNRPRKAALAARAAVAGPGFSLSLQTLARARLVALDGAWVRLPTHEVRLSPPDESLWLDIEPLLGGTERFRPPRVRDIAGKLNIHEPEVRRVLKLLSRMGKIDEIAHDHFFLRQTTAEIVDIVCDIAFSAPIGEFTAAQLRDRLDNGRKVAIQILEFFDRHGVTLRRGDVRRINKHRLDLFAPARQDAKHIDSGRESSPVGRADFKSGRGRETVLGGFDSLSLPPVNGAI